MAQQQAQAELLNDGAPLVELDAEVTQCPACEGEFAPAQLTQTDGRCPNCGLRLGPSAAG